MSRHMKRAEYIIVIGASAGGLKTTIELVSKFPPSLNAAIFVVIHFSKASSADIILNMFQKEAKLACRIVENGSPIEAGVVYLARPDHHLFVKKDRILVTHGPKENLWRPSIDVLFRSAATAYRTRVIGIILSGLLDDGVSGMAAVKRCGGKCIVQEPYEAEFNDMPLNVLKAVEVDYRLSLSDIPYVITDLLSKPAGENHPVPPEIEKEITITETMNSTIDQMKEISTETTFTCPDCGGILWEMKDDTHRYRCQTGHVYTENVFVQRQADELEDSLWASIRLLEERKDLLLKVALHESYLGNVTAQAAKTKEAEALKVHIERLKIVQTMIAGGKDARGPL
jgi:two-component system, chemotaxis family, protein-glutamate methylesterase/glutaminase